MRRQGHTDWGRRAGLALLGLVVVASADLTLARSRPAPPAVEGGHDKVAAEVPADPSMQAFLEPLRAEMDAQVNAVLGEATAPLSKGGAESALGNFVTDAMRAAVEKKTGKPADIAITNNGGLRAPIAAGPITLRNIIEVMPFENRLMVLRFTGAQLRELVAQIARRGGVPQSGMTLEIRDGEAVTALVGGEPIDDERVYTVVTTDYLYNVGGKMSAFQQDPKPTRSCLILRDVLVDAVKEAKTLSPRIDGRTKRLKGKGRRKR